MLYLEEEFKNVAKIHDIFRMDESENCSLKIESK